MAVQSTRNPLSGRVSDAAFGGKMDGTVRPSSLRLLSRRDVITFCAGVCGAATGIATAAEGAIGASRSSTPSYQERTWQAPPAPRYITFAETATELPLGNNARERFVIDGHLTMSNTGVGGEVKVTFTDLTCALIGAFEGNFVSTYGKVTVRLPLYGDTAQVRGTALKVRALVEQLIAENDLSGIEPLSDTSRAVIALNALANTNLFVSAMDASSIVNRTRLLNRLRRLSPAPSAATCWWRRQVGQERTATAT